MDFFIALVVFLCGIFLCMIQGWSLVPGLAFGMVCFAAVARYRGHRVREIISMAAEGARTALVVVRILLLIGCLTALWRASGTIAFFMHAGLTMIDSNIFLLMAFLLSALLSLTFGSVFGTAGTVGVILMAMARTGGADPAMTAGAVLSGAYFGERVSPASASAALTAALTGVDQNQFQRSMWRSTPVPLLLSLAFYGVLSYWFPIQQVEPDILTALEESFRLSWPTVLPAVFAAASAVFSCKGGVGHFGQLYPVGGTGHCGSRCILGEPAVWMPVWVGDESSGAVQNPVRRGSGFDGQQHGDRPLFLRLVWDSKWGPNAGAGKEKAGAAGGTDKSVFDGYFYCHRRSGIAVQSIHCTGADPADAGRQLPAPRL